MNIWTSLIGALFGGEKSPISVALERILPDTNARKQAEEAFKMELLKYAQNSETAQLEVNKVEAAHASVFVAGWRPAVGWTCCFALAWQFVLQPIFSWMLAVVLIFYPDIHFPALPVLNLESILTVLGGILGLGGLRTVEKIKGEVDRSSLKES